MKLFGGSDGLDLRYALACWKADGLNASITSVEPDLAKFFVFDETKPIAIIGMGIMGTKVAWACARSNLKTFVFDTQANQAESSRELALTWGDSGERERVAEKLVVKSHMGSALEGVQLAFENLGYLTRLKRRSHTSSGAIGLA